MMAVAEVQPTRTLDQYERAALRRELSRWGSWMDRRDDFNPYPTMDNVERARVGRGGGTQGHRILCLDMPDDVYATHWRVIGLVEPLRKVVWSVHCNIVTKTGDLIPWEWRCVRIGLTERTGRRMYSRALLAIAGIG